MTSCEPRRNMALSAVLCLLSWSPAVADEPEEAKPFEVASSDIAVATRDASAVYLQIQEADANKCSIPRLYAPLVSSTWQDSGEAVQVTPEQDHWVIKWKRPSAESKTIVLKFGAHPATKEELEPIVAQS
ncbi:MAG: hypothetical protein AAGG44_03665, partial [Planctomycetota bacterium]